MKHLYKVGLRKCCVCKRILALTPANFQRNHRENAGLGYACKSCVREERHSKYKKLKTHTPGVVYLLESSGYYKIGLCKSSEICSVDMRIKDMQTGNPCLIKKVAVYMVDDVFSVEKRLHNVFRCKRVRGEWFDLCDEDLSTLEGIVGDGCLSFNGS